jgi:hypothetical protein
MFGLSGKENFYKYNVFLFIWGLHLLNFRSLVSVHYTTARGNGQVILLYAPFRSITLKRPLASASFMKGARGGAPRT